MLGIPNRLLVDDHSTRPVLCLGMSILISVIKGVWRILDLNRPGVSYAFYVKPFPDDPDFAPGIPVGGNKDLVSVDDIMLERLSF
jgi:hypothetical protein